ncbi:hypothetical protein [Enterococcus sp. JM4C]|uniref:hypothetical protein n=1 Tax=Candidatus Enterococcus huntleyi TaxID=1857217 RepID=UPI001379960F
MKNRALFKVTNGILFGKSQDETFWDEYNHVLVETINEEQPSILYNINLGHAAPRCILPIGVNVKVDTINQEIIFLENPFAA